MPFLFCGARVEDAVFGVGVSRRSAGKGAACRRHPFVRRRNSKGCYEKFITAFYHIILIQTLPYRADNICPFEQSIYRDCRAQ